MVFIFKTSCFSARQRSDKYLASCFLIATLFKVDKHAQSGLCVDYVMFGEICPADLEWSAAFTHGNVKIVINVVYSLNHSVLVIITTTSCIVHNLREEFWLNRFYF